MNKFDEIYEMTVDTAGIAGTGTEHGGDLTSSDFMLPVMLVYIVS